MSESKFLRHDPCPKCGSKDNLGVWDDGHKWCFGCGFYVAPHGISWEAIKARKGLEQPKSTALTITLPHDACDSFPPTVKNWLSAYNIHHPDIVRYKIQYSHSNGAIIFPIYDHDNNLLMYQLRYLDRKPKYFNKGDVGDFLPIFSATHAANQLNTHTIVVVEDFVSAIKVSNHLHCMPLFGSHLSTQKMAALSKLYDNLFIWLDQDKFGKALELSQQAALIFKRVHPVRTAEDPKAYFGHEIGTRLRASLDLFTKV